MSRDEYVLKIKSTFVTMGTRSAMTYLVAQYPFLANPIANKILKMFVEKVLLASADAAEMGAFFMYIDWRTAEQNKDWQNAVSRNLQAQLTGTDQEKKDAELNLINSARSFIKLSN